MGTKASRMVLSESESLCSNFIRRTERKNKKKSSKPTPLSNYDVKISPNRVIRGKSEALVKIVSISGDEEIIPVILSPAGEATSNKRQPAKNKKKKKPIGFDAAEIKVKSYDTADISVKSLESKVYTEELAPKQISGEEKDVTLRKLNHRSWVRIAKAFLSPMDPKSRNELKVSQKSSRGHHAKDTKTSVIEQPKAEQIHQENEIRDSIPRPIIQLYSKSSRTSEKVDSKSCKLLKSNDFHRKVNSHASAPNSPFKRREIKSAPRFSSSPSSQLPHRNMATIRNSPTGSSGDATGEGEGYGSAINLCVLIIILGCLVVFSDRLLAVVCASIWWYLVPCLLKKYNGLTRTDGIKIKRSVERKRTSQECEQRSSLHWHE